MTIWSKDLTSFIFSIFFLFFFHTKHADCSLPSLNTSEHTFLLFPRSITPQFHFKKEQAPQGHQQTSHNKMQYNQIQILTLRLDEATS